MYLEVKSDELREIIEAARKQIDSGVPAMLDFGRNGDFYTLSINTSGDEDSPLSSA